VSSGFLTGSASGGRRCNTREVARATILGKEDRHFLHNASVPQDKPLGFPPHQDYPIEKRIEKAIKALVDSWDMDTLINYTHEQLLAWAETADQEELDRLLEETKVE